MPPPVAAPVAPSAPAPAAGAKPPAPAGKAPEPSKVTPFPAKATKEPAPSKPPEAEGGEVKEGGADEDPRELWRKAVKGKTIKHKGVEKQLADFDPDEAADLIRRGYGATELVSATNKAKAEAEAVLSLKKALEEGDDDAALDAMMQFGGERGLKLLDKLRAQVQAQQAEEEGMTERERAALTKQREAEAKAAQLEQSARQRQEQERIAQAKREEATVRNEGLQKANLVVKELQGFPAEHAEVLLPFVGRAWREAIEAGDELGRDVDPSVVVKRATALFRESTLGHLGRLQPAQQFDFLGEKTVEALSRELVRRRRSAPLAVAAPAGAPKPKAEAPKGPQLGDPDYLRR